VFFLVFSCVFYVFCSLLFLIGLFSFCGIMGYIDKIKYLDELREVCVLKGFSRVTIRSYSFCVSSFLGFSCEEFV